MAHSFSRFLYCDTNILSYLAKEPELWRRLAEYLLECDLTIAVGVQAAELADAQRLHDRLTALLLGVPSAIIKPSGTILEEEVRAHPAARTEPLLLYPINAMLAEPEGPDRLRQFLSSAALNTARCGQREAAAQLPSRHAALKSNFPPSPDGKYSRAQAKEFTWIQVVQWLAGSHVAFLERFKADVSALHVETFASVRLFALVLFYKYYLGGRQPNSRSDLGDMAHLHAIPYCNVVVVERDMANTLRQIQRHDAVLAHTDVYDIDFFKTWPAPGGMAG